MIKDSGERREFNTGAVRDMAEGKGRFDLMPLIQIGNLLDNFIFLEIGKYVEQKDVNYLYAAARELMETMWNNQQTPLLELAKHFENGAKKYGENNWQKGLPVSCYIDSFCRHYCKALRGDKDEPHDVAALWNLVCAIWTIENKGDA